MLLAHVLKTRDEDAFLATSLAAAYPAYQDRVPYRLLPGLW